MQLGLLGSALRSILEWTEYTNKTISFLDIDETVFKTFAEIFVKDKDGNIIKKLSNTEFNRYKLQPGESFSFEDFANTDKFVKTSIKIPTIIKEINKMLNVDRLTRGLDRIVFVTARNNMDNKKQFLAFLFHQLGLPMRNQGFVRVERAGKIQDEFGGSIPDIKRDLIKKYLDEGIYKTARMFDDYEPNLRAFLSLQDEYPNIKFKAILVDDDKLKLID